MNKQEAMFRFTLTLARNHPDMYGKFINMTQTEIAEFVNNTYNTNIERGCSWDVIDAVVDVMDEVYYASKT